MSEVHVIARVGDQRIAVAATAVEAVVDLSNVTPLPLAPSHIRGLAALRSQVLTVIDTGSAVGGIALASQGRAIVVSCSGHRYALRVDAVDDVAECADGADDAASPMAAGWAAVAVGRLSLPDGFAIAVDPARFVSGTAIL